MTDVYLRAALSSLASWMTAASRLIGIYKIVSFINEDILGDIRTYMIEYTVPSRSIRLKVGVFYFSRNPRKSENI